MKKISNNLGLKLLAIVIAVILWLVVVNIEDPVDTKKISGIEVQLINPEAVTSQGKVYEVADNTNVISVTVKAKRSVLDKLTAYDFKATADLNELDYETGEVPYTVVALTDSSKIDKITPRSDCVKLILDDNATREFDVESVITGEPEAGYAVGDIKLSLEKATVSGPAAVINTIKNVVVSIDATGVTESFERKVNLEFRDEAGNVVGHPLITVAGIEGLEINASVEVLTTKSVSMKFATEGTPATGYQFMEFVCSPPTVMIKGPADVLKDISVIEIPTLIDIDGASDDVVQAVDVAAALPTGVKLADSNIEEVKVTARIGTLTTKSFSIPVTKITLKNVPNDLAVRYKSQDDVTFSVKGDSEDVAKIDSAELTGTIDMSGCKVGEQTVTVDITLPSGVSLASEVNVRVVVSRGAEGEV